MQRLKTVLLTVQKIEAGPSSEELADNKYRIADAAYGDRLELDDDLFVISVKDMHLPSKAIAEWVTDAITNIDEDVAR